MKSCIGCEVAEATVAAICAACDHLVCNAFELAEKQMLVSLPSLAASSASKGDINQMLAAEVNVGALYWTSDQSAEKQQIDPPLRTLPSSPGDIYEMQAAAAADFYGDEENQQSIFLPSLTATSSVYKENEETEAVTAFLAPLALLTESPGNIYKEVLEEPARPARSGLGSKRSRAAEVHNLSEKRRKSRIDEKMKALQNFIPNSNKENKETEAVTAFLAPLALLTESPGNIYKDPKEKAKSETRDWLNNLVTDLESQIDNFEAEADGLTVKKGKTRPARLTHLETSISRHKAHIVKLEVVLRLLDNDGLSPDQVNDIKDFLEDYVERNQENFDEFDNADELYSSLPLDQELEELAALVPTLVKKTIVQDQSEEPSPQDTNSVVSPRIPPSKSGTMGSLVSAPLSSVGCGTPTVSSSAVTANILVRPLVGGPTAASTISGPVTVQGFVENSAAAVSSSLLNSSNLVKDDDATFPTRTCSPAIPEIGLGRCIGRGISSQVSVGLPMSLGSVGGIDGNVALGSATPVSDTAKRNMLNVDERVGAGVSQTLVSPLSNRILLQQASKDTEGTASNDSNNVCEGVVGGRVFPTSVVTGVQWKPQSLSPYQNQNETGQFRGRPDITPDQREKFLERFEQIEQVTQHGHNSLLTVPHLSGANYKQFSPQQQNLSLQQDCSDVDDTHGTCVWAARFKFSSFAAVDTQVTKPAQRRGESDTFDHMRKKFYYITDDIMVLTSGIVPLSQICIGILRVLKDKFELTGQNKKERSGKPRKILVLKKLVSLFLNGSNLKTFMHNVKARKGRYFAKGEEDDSSSLILISRCEETEESVCKIKLVLGDESISVHWGWVMGDGSGYSTAAKTLAELTQSSDETQIIEVVKRAFRNASIEDDGTGGSVLILKGSKDEPWDLLEACDI